MLKRFTVKNFKNFKNKITLDLTSSNYEFNNKSISNNVVKNSIIYGHNGSGKSNIVKAIMDVTTHLTDYRIDESAYQLYLCLDSEENSAFFSYEFSFGEDVVIYSYRKKSLNEIFDEYIYINGNLVIDSKNKIVNIPGTGNLDLNYDETISFIKYVLRNTVMDSKDPNTILIKKFDNFVQGMLSFNSLQGNTFQGLETGAESLTSIILRESSITEFEKFLKECGLEYNLKIKNVDNVDVITAIFEANKEVDLFKVISKGTSALILFYTWSLKFDKVSMVLMDEFDSYYHNDLTRMVIKIVKEKNVQSLFSSHNTSVMSNDLLRPDCYFVLEDHKIKSLDKSTNKELRKAHNLEKMYKAGAFD